MIQLFNFGRRIAFLMLPLACVAMLGTASVHAGVLGPVYPPPGGNDWSGNGVSAANGTAIWNYSNFDVSGVDELYFGLNQIDYGAAGAGLHYSANAFVFQGAAGTTATWEADTTWKVATSSTNQHIAAQTRLMMTVSGLGSNPWITDLTSVGLEDAGLFGSLGAVVDNSAGNDFTLTFKIEGNVGSGWQAINSIQQHSDHNGATRSSIATGFYYVEAANTVPEPTSLAIFGLGAICMTGVRRRRSRSKLS